MDLNVGKELAALKRMSVDALRTRYAEVFGEATSGRHKPWLVKRIIWRMQSLAEGDLNERARRRAAELAKDADIRRKAPKSPPASPDAAGRTRVLRLPTSGDRRTPIPGSLITRVYKGQNLAVKVLLDRLNKPLHKGVRVRRPECALLDLHPPTLQPPIEHLRELGVEIVLHQRDRQIALAGLRNEGVGLRDDPLFVRMKRRRRQDDLPGFHV